MNYDFEWNPNKAILKSITLALKMLHLFLKMKTLFLFMTKNIVQKKIGGSLSEWI